MWYADGRCMSVDGSPKIALVVWLYPWAFFAQGGTSLVAGQWELCRHSPAAPAYRLDSRMWFVKSFLLLFIVIVLSFPSTRLRFSSNPKRSQNEDCVAQWQRVGFQSQRLRVRFSSRSSFFGFSSQKASAGRHPGLFFAPPDPYMRLEMDVSYLQLQF